MANYYDTWHQNFWLDTVWPEEFWYSDDATYAGDVSVTLADLSPALTGSSFEPGAVSGHITVTLAPLSSNLPGSTSTTILFDIPVGLSVNWLLETLAVVDGSIAYTLEDLTPALSGVAWENSYADGRIESTSLFWPALFWGDLWTPEFWLTTPNLEGVSASLEGFLASPGDYVSTIAASLDGASSTILGAIYDPANYNGSIYSILGGLTSALSGTHVDPVQTGSISASFDGITGLVQGLALPAGVTIGRISRDLDGISAFECYGQVFVTPKTGSINHAPLDDLTSRIEGLALPVGAKWGPLRVILGGLGASIQATHQSPRARARPQVPQVTEIDWKTLTDQHNAGLPVDQDYEFSNGRRFKQG